MSEDLKSTSKDSPPSDEEEETEGASARSEGSSGESRSMMDALKELFSRGLHISKPEKEDVEHLLKEVSFDGVVKYMISPRCKNVIAMVGAGISTSAGIPDFRSPGSGIYNNLQKYNLPSPECMFDINFFKKCPEPFYDLAKELFPTQFKPTPCHYFLRLLHEKGYLTRLYTQNIDTLERVAGIPGEKLVEAHGTFHTSHCIKSSCRKLYTLDWMKEKIFSDQIPKCTECGNLIKPDIVFFGERLPEHFFRCSQRDFRNCDLLIIIGTSLTVQPFAGLVDNVPPETPRLLINKEKCGRSNPLALMMGYAEGLDFDSKDNYRDVAWLGLCDDGCKAMAEALGWKEELKKLIQEEHARIDKEAKDELDKVSKEAAQI